MDTIHDVALQAVHDALVIQGLTDGPGFIRTADPRGYMNAERLRLAEQVAKQLPAGTTAATATAAAVQLEPMIRALLGK